MKRLRILALILILTVIAGPVVFASDITGSKFSATVVVSNNGSATTNTSTIFTANATVYQDHGYLNATANNTVMRNSSGADLPFQVGYTPGGYPWVVWVPAISADGYATDILYFADSSGGELRYFPDAAGMVTSDNDTLLELSDNFSLGVAGFFDATVADSIIDKPQTITLSGDGAGGISGSIAVGEPIDVTPTVFASWEDMDLSAFIPASATGVVLQVDANIKDCGFRKKGSTDARIQHMYHNYVMIGVDGNRICEAYIEDNTVDVYLIGYTDSSWTYKTNTDNVSLIALGAWTDIDVTVQAPGAYGVIIEVVNKAGAAAMGLRNDGSADARYGTLQATSHFWYVVGDDNATEIFEGIAQNNGVEFHLIGYTTAGSTFQVNGVNKAIGAGVWTDIDCSVQAPNATFLFFETWQAGGGPDNFGFRPNGSAFAALGPGDWDKSNSVVPCDSGQITEGYVSNANLDFYLQGYATTGIYTPAIAATVSSVASGERVIELTADGTELELMVDRGEASEVSDNTSLGGAAVANTSANYTSFANYIMPYVEYQEITVGGNQRQFIEWQYSVNFTDQSGNGQTAVPSFRTASSDPDISANLTSFTPISQAKAPAYALGPVNPFISGTGNVTGNFTIVPPVGTFPLAGVIAAVAGATATPPQLPLLIIAAFVILAASLTTTYLLKKYGSGSLLVKAFVIIGVMGIFIALGDFGIDFWMLIVFSIMAVALAMASRQSTWGG